MPPEEVDNAEQQFNRPASDNGNNVSERAGLVTASLSSIRDLLPTVVRGSVDAEAMLSGFSLNNSSLLDLTAGGGGKTERGAGLNGIDVQQPGQRQSDPNEVPTGQQQANPRQGGDGQQMQTDQGQLSTPETGRMNFPAPRGGVPDGGVPGPPPPADMGDGRSALGLELNPRLADALNQERPGDAFVRINANQVVPLLARIRGGQEVGNLTNEQVQLLSRLIDAEITSTHRPTDRSDVTADDAIRSIRESTSRNPLRDLNSVQLALLRENVTRHMESRRLPVPAR